MRPVSRPAKSGLLVATSAQLKHADKVPFDPVVTGQGTAAHGLVGVQLRERPETEPRVRLPAEPPVDESDVGIVGMVFLVATFQLGPHQRVVRHAAFLQ
eukprot:926275-Amphidinium_carterae.1